MGRPANKTKKTDFTATEKKLLSGLSVKVATKRSCSAAYVRHIINGTRNTNTILAKKILNDLYTSLELFRPEE